MPVYRVTVTVKTLDHVHPDDVADHVASAASQWGGQYHPDHPLFSSEVSVSATCRGFTRTDDDFDTFLNRKGH
jgi:hypothetical protein